MSLQEVLQLAATVLSMTVCYSEKVVLLCNGADIFPAGYLLLAPQHLVTGEASFPMLQRKYFEYKMIQFNSYCYGSNLMRIFFLSFFFECKVGQLQDPAGAGSEESPQGTSHPRPG